jgi:hypothetical protein
MFVRLRVGHAGVSTKGATSLRLPKGCLRSGTRRVAFVSFNCCCLRALRNFIFVLVGGCRRGWVWSACIITTGPYIPGRATQIWKLNTVRNPLQTKRRRTADKATHRRDGDAQPLRRGTAATATWRSAQAQRAGAAHRRSTQAQHTGAAHRRSTQAQRTGAAHRRSAQARRTGAAHRRSARNSSKMPRASTAVAGAAGSRNMPATARGCQQQQEDASRNSRSSKNSSKMPAKAAAAGTCQTQQRGASKSSDSSKTPATAATLATAARRQQQQWH